MNAFDGSDVQIDTPGQARDFLSDLAALLLISPELLNKFIENNEVFMNSAFKLLIVTISALSLPLAAFEIVIKDEGGKKEEEKKEEELPVPKPATVLIAASNQTEIDFWVSIKLVAADNEKIAGHFDHVVGPKSYVEIGSLKGPTGSVFNIKVAYVEFLDQALIDYYGTKWLTCRAMPSTSAPKPASEDEDSPKKHLAAKQVFFSLIKKDDQIIPNCLVYLDW